MSFQTRGRSSVVVCDLCGVASAIGDARLRLMRKTGAGVPQHLCPDCRMTSEWCATHEVYHRSHDLHRCACADCGGLFTSRFGDKIAHCPSCLRARRPADQPAPGMPQQAAPRSQRGLTGWFAHLGLHLPRRR